MYRLIASNSSDVFLNNISFDKALMHQAFIGASVKIRKLHRVCYSDGRDLT